MSALFVLVGISLAVAVIFLAAFFWSVKQGQYDDDYTPAVRILFDDHVPIEPTENKNKTTINK